MLIQCLLCFRYCRKYHRNVYSFNHHSNTTRLILILFAFYRAGSSGTARLRNFSMVVWLMNGREWIEIPTIYLQNCAFNLYTELQIELILLLL